jgi:2-amino-4-hydroxy-6-hydroxymethyldihydropteridine diphosphokinase
VRVAIALGSNLGDREAHLSFAVAALGRLLRNLTSSSWIETDPSGVGAQPRFLNGAVAGDAALSARALLDELLRLEAERGRVRRHAGDPGKGPPGRETMPPEPAKLPRTLDLDLILYGDAVIDEPGLVIPHPRFRERLFVLEPLAEVAGDWTDPVTGLTVSALRSRLARRRPS